MKLSDQIEQALADHAAAYPNGDFRSVNDRLGELFMASWGVLVKAGKDPTKGGNEGRIKALREIGH